MLSYVEVDVCRCTVSNAFDMTSAIAIFLLSIFMWNPLVIVLFIVCSFLWRSDLLCIYVDMCDFASCL